MLREKHLHHNSRDQPASLEKPVAVQVNCSHHPKKTHIVEADRFARVAGNLSCVSAHQLVCSCVPQRHNARLGRALGVSALSCTLMSLCQQQYDERGTWTFQQVCLGSQRDLSAKPRASAKDTVPRISSSNLRYNGLSSLEKRFNTSIWRPAWLCWRLCWFFSLCPRFCCAGSHLQDVRCATLLSELVYKAADARDELAFRQAQVKVEEAVGASLSHVRCHKSGGQR